MQNYKNPALTVDALVINKKQEILLIKRLKDPFKGFFAFPGGFVDYGEDPEKAVLRELEEETHLKGIGKPELVSVKGDPSRDPRQHVVTIAYKVDIDFNSLSSMRADDDAEDVQWIPLESILEGKVTNENIINLAFDHFDIANDFNNFLKRKK
jgi:8-oxo-dGTP diphosphatase